MEQNIIFYSTPEGNINIQVVMEQNSCWLSQIAMAALFGVAVPAISKHLADIFESMQLDENSVISILETTASDGKQYKTKYLLIKK
jgi:hypothetical protein